MSDWLESNWAAELRQLWNDYDPIGVYHFDDNQNDWPEDEYDSYHGLIIRHLNKGSGHEWIFKDVKKTVTGNIGVTWSPKMEKLTNDFVSNVLIWFEAKKPELKK